MGKRTLIEMGAKLSPRVLHTAAKTDLESLLFFLNFHPSLFQFSDYYAPPRKMEDDELMRYIINESGALRVAVEGRRLDMVKELLKRGADGNKLKIEKVESSYFLHPIDYSKLEEKQLPMEIIELLMPGLEECSMGGESSRKRKIDDCS